MNLFRAWRTLVCGLALATSSAVFAQTGHEGFERAIRTALAPLTGQSIATYTVVHLDAEHAPWTDTGITLAAGDRVTVLLQGRAWLSRHYDISLEAPLQVWRRIGEQGRITRGIDAYDTFTAERAGPLQIKNLPLRWLDPHGAALESGVRGNPDGGGGASVAVIRWSPGANIGATLAALARRPDGPAWAAPALARLQTPPGAPEGWSYLWSSALPAGETFRCPLPGWKDRETHVVVRSGTAELGKWLNEARNVWRDYAQAIGGEPPKRIVRVWLIANSVFGRGEGRAELGDIRLGANGQDRFVW